MKNELISSYISDFLTYHRVDKAHSEETIIAYKKELNYIFGILESEILPKTFKKKSKLFNYKIDEIEVKHIRSLLRFLKDERNNSESTLARKISCLASFFNFLNIYDYIEKNIMLKIETQKIPKKEIIIPSREEIKKLFDHINSRKYRNEFEGMTIKLFFYLKFNTMARTIEMVRVKVKDIDFNKKEINLHGKGNKARKVILNKSMVKKIRDYITFANLDEDDFLIRNRYNKPITKRALEKRVKKIIIETGLNERMTSHPLLRKAPATLMWLAGIRLTEIQDLLGHENPTTTRLYVKPLMKDLHEKLDKSHPLETYFELE